MQLKNLFLALPLSLALPPPLSAQDASLGPWQHVQNPGVRGNGPGEWGGWVSQPGPQLPLLEKRLFIPGFQPGDGERHIYVLTFFSDSGVGNTNLYPIEDGSALISIPLLEGAGDHEPALLISSLDIDTEEERFSFDLLDVKASALVNALFNARTNLLGDLAQLRGERRRSAFEGGLPPRNDLLLRDRRVTLRGENLSLDETLDRLYDASGCSVFLEGRFLVARSCL